MIDYRAPLEELPDPLPIVPLEKPFDVTITPPGSKSITNRAYVLAALAEGESRIIRPLRAEDTDLLLDALCTLGAEARWDGEDVFIKGVGGRFPRGGSVNLGDGGTPTRFMIAVACLAAEPVIVDGSPRMRERPIAEGVEMLRQLGARIEYVEEEGRLPVRVVPSDSFKGGELKIGKTASSQFMSALLLIGPWLERGVDIRFHSHPTSLSYISMTTRVLVDWQDDVLGHIDDIIGNDRVSIEPLTLHGALFAVEPDASSAIYWVMAAAIAGARVRIPHLPRYSAQPDVHVMRELEMRHGLADVAWPNDITALKPMEWLDASHFPDGAIVFAVALSTTSGTSHLCGLHTLRVKETDRIAALANELRKIGCTVETSEDSITITPPDAAPDDRREEDADGSARGRGISGAPSGSSSLRSSDPASVVIETYNDHRMAMSFAILGLVRPGIAIRNPKCVAKSYPTFWRDFARLYE